MLMPCFRSSLSKIGALFVAVMLALVCMCPVAFAAEISAPAYPSTIVSGVEFQTLSNFGGQPPYFEVIPGVEYTITADMNFALQWWDGNSWEYWPEYNNVASPATIVFDDSIQYVAISSHGYTSDIATCTISWDEPTPVSRVIGAVLDFSSGMLDVGSSLISWMFAPVNTVVLLGVVLFVMVAIVSGIRKFIPGL